MANEENKKQKSGDKTQSELVRADDSVFNFADTVQLFTYVRHNNCF